MIDTVNHPPHYTSNDAKCSACGHSIECIDVTRHMDFNVGNAVKYLWRYKHKGGIEDLQKARWYIEDAISDYSNDSLKETISTKCFSLIKYENLKKLGVPYSKSHIYHLMSKGDFPKPVKLGEGKVAWLESDIKEWVNKKNF